MLVTCLAADGTGRGTLDAALGVGGHLLHHHGVIGAAAGCAIGHHHAKVKAKEQPAP